MLVRLRSLSSEKGQLLAPKRPACNKPGGSPTTSCADPLPWWANLMAAASKATRWSSLEEKQGIYHASIPLFHPRLKRNFKSLPKSTSWSITGPELPNATAKTFHLCQATRSVNVFESLRPGMTHSTQGEKNMK